MTQPVFSYQKVYIKQKSEDTYSRMWYEFSKG